MRKTRQRASAQVSLKPPPCEELTTIDPSTREKRVRPLRHTLVCLPDSTNALRIRHAAAGLAVLVDGGQGAEVHDLLRDEAARFGLDRRAQPAELGGVELAAEHHAVAARLGDVLDDERVEPVHHIRHVVGIDGQVGRGVVDERLLVEVVVNHGGDEVVDALVVGHAVARRVDDGDVARTVGADEVGHADERVGVEVERVEELVRDAAVHDADLVLVAQVVDEVQPLVLDDEVVGERQTRTRLLGEVAVLEERRVVAPRGQDDGYSLAAHEVHAFAQQLGVGPVVEDGVGAEDLGGDVALDVAHYERVARARRDAQVVLEDVPGSVLGLHEVLSGDVGVDAAWRGDAVDLRKVAARRVDEVLGDHAVADDLLVGVDVAQKRVERVDALDEAPLQVGELLRADDARDGVVGKQLLDELALLVDAETHAVAGELLVHPVAAVDEFPEVYVRVELLHRCPLASRLSLPRDAMRRRGTCSASVARRRRPSGRWGRIVQPAETRPPPDGR